MDRGRSTLAAGADPVCYRCYFGVAVLPKNLFESSSSIAREVGSTIDVIVTLQIKPGMEAAAEEILRQLESETTENDKGCLRYQWYRAEHAGTYYLLE